MKLSSDNYIFDTTVFIDYLRGNPVAQDIFNQVKTKNLSVGYSILTETELWAGIKGQQSREIHLRLLKPFKRYNLNVAIARRAGELRSAISAQKGQRIPVSPVSWTA